MSFSLQTHIPVSDQDGKTSYQVRPYIRIKMGDHPAVNIQSGCFYGDGGVELSRDDLPGVFWDEVAKLTKEARKSVGLDPDDIGPHLMASKKAKSAS